MKNFKSRYGTWAVVAGAAEGIGLAYSKALAKRGISVIMVDVQGHKLLAEAQSLADEYDVEVQSLELDLAQKESVRVVMRSVRDCDCRLLIYNAAYGPVMPFLANSEDDLDLYIDVNCRTLLHLTHRFAGHLKTGRSGGIVLMSSLAGLWGTGLVAPYGASKAFDYNLAEALHYELVREGIDVMTCCAGATDTPNFRSTKPKYGLLRPAVADPDKVAEGALKMLGKKAVYIPGFSNKLTHFLFTRVFGRAIGARVFNHTMRRMYL